jgi:hypothetical protein
MTWVVWPLLGAVLVGIAFLCRMVLRLLREREELYVAYERLRAENSALRQAQLRRITEYVASRN